MLSLWLITVAEIHMKWTHWKHTKCTVKCCKYSNKKFAILFQDKSLYSLNRHPHIKTLQLNQETNMYMNNTSKWNNGHSRKKRQNSIFFTVFWLFFFVTMVDLVWSQRQSTCLMWTKLCFLSWILCKNKILLADEENVVYLHTNVLNLFGYVCAA